MIKNRMLRALDYVGSLAWFFGLKPVAAIARRAVPSMRNVWLVMERGNDARDNGYWFYRFLREQHPEINARYVIAEDSLDFSRVSVLGETVGFGSLRHKLLYLCADVLAGSYGLFAFSCIFWLGTMFLLAWLLLRREDVRA